ncbi:MULTISPECIES: VWA domain-containing protein [Actinoalloteichus]|uniref:von Willebrand factor type A domain n=1 Tax=Actinoalloteichus fjordicus TaxID=1612552 RepID=A0AAC9LDK5_9PSEU|nr:MULTISPECIES: VWA domain-containing protein [Actinoalloteichus]APU14395.1 von Willebrand factor type A domain [Actinoalloteichus fjordicus]APU20364.1 von Willebrand factor type A domain [Actinoalloteichus sp. GBA129-24]
MVSGLDFEVTVDQNRHLPVGGRDVDAIVTVTAAESGETGSVGSAATEDTTVVIMVDCSSSMNWPRARIAAARQATVTAVDALREGVRFAVIAGNLTARMVYPPHRGLARADAAGRAAAKQAIRELRADGGTAMSRWLLLAEELFRSQPGGVRHAILLTDGVNQGEDEAELAEGLAACRDRFVCDCRGIGTDWRVPELRRIAETLLGTVDIVAEPGNLAEDFRAMTDAAMGKEVADVALRLWTPQTARLRFVKQVDPDMVDLSERRVPSGAMTDDFPTGSWGAETRAYHVGVEIEPIEMTDRMLAARISVVTPSSDQSGPLATGLVLAEGTADLMQATIVNREVAHYTGQAELAGAIREGLAARAGGDLDMATRRLGRAAELAESSGHRDTARLLAEVVEVDEHTGTVRLRSRISAEAEMTLDARSTRTARVRPQASQEDG